MPVLLTPGNYTTAALTPLSWTVAWLAITHTCYAAFDINAGHVLIRLGKPFFFYHRYAELALHLLIGVRFLRPAHLLMAAWHLWKYIDVTAGGRVARFPRFAHALDWIDAVSWLWSGWLFNAGAASVPVFVGASATYAVLLYAVWGPGVRGNDKQGSISYGASLLQKATR
jgi:hypothetical protein